MARRSYSKAVPGQLYAVEWPEWHIECPLCDARAFIVPMGEASTLKQAESVMASNGGEEGQGWVKRNGLWQCPKHTGEM